MFTSLDQLIEASDGEGSLTEEDGSLSSDRNGILDNRDTDFVQLLTVTDAFAAAAVVVAPAVAPPGND